jgi:hypothetical protein
MENFDVNLAPCGIAFIFSNYYSIILQVILHCALFQLCALKVKEKLQSFINFFSIVPTLFEVYCFNDLPIDFKTNCFIQKDRKGLSKHQEKEQEELSLPQITLKASFDSKTSQSNKKDNRSRERLRFGSILIIFTLRTAL